MLDGPKYKLEELWVTDLLQYAGPFRHRYQFKEEVTANKTLDAEDNGKLLVVTTDALTITLPSTGTAYGPYHIMNGGAAGAVLITISPAAADKIFGCDMAGVDNKDLLNTKATAEKGDFVSIYYGGATGWSIGEMRGTWAAEA